MNIKDEIVDMTKSFEQEKLNEVVDLTTKLQNQKYEFENQKNEFEIK